MKTKVITTATVILIFNSMAIADILASTDADYSFMTTLDWHNCQQIGTEYREVYAFETNSFFINICQKDDSYFYSVEAKQSNQSSVFIPAHPLKNNQGFRARNGNLSYLVLLPFGSSKTHHLSPEPTEAILTIKRNGQLASVESSLNKYCHQSEDAIAQLKDSVVAFDSIELQKSDQIDILPQYQNFGSNLSLANQENEDQADQEKFFLPETFESGSRFDFYLIGGELHRLTTCK